ncbi:MAG: UDP-N-acetylmuramate dehydrogenase [Lachnospiraceae bacterium]|nr:UDP-N-acetylmuramate dehydrogenase [Lachnospiraceae bacterium]
MDGSELRKILPASSVQENVPLGPLTTFRAGGPARFFVTPEDAEAFSLLVRFLEERHEPFFVLGRGSNLLVSDKGYEGTVIYTRKTLNLIEKTADGLGFAAECGALLQDLSLAAQASGLSGLAFAHGIPGTVGGAVLMNAGAYGSEIRDVIKSASILGRDGRIRSFSRDELELGYRHSAISDGSGFVISAAFALKEGDPQEIRSEMNELMRRRKEKQPLEYASAGSTFKRPEGYYAGALIQEAGLKGTLHVGDAWVSEKHAGFVVNKGHASASEIYEVIRMAQDAVYRHSGVLLEPEVRFLGEFG